MATRSRGSTNLNLLLLQPLLQRRQWSFRRCLPTQSILSCSGYINIYIYIYIYKSLFRTREVVRVYYTTWWERSLEFPEYVVGETRRAHSRGTLPVTDVLHLLHASLFPLSPPILITSLLPFLTPSLPPSHSPSLSRSPSLPPWPWPLSRARSLSLPLSLSHTSAWRCRTAWQSLKRYSHGLGFRV